MQKDTFSTTVHEYMLIPVTAIPRSYERLSFTCKTLKTMLYHLYHLPHSYNILTTFGLCSCLAFFLTANPHDTALEASSRLILQSKVFSKRNSPSLMLANTWYLHVRRLCIERRPGDVYLNLVDKRRTNLLWDYSQKSNW